MIPLPRPHIPITVNAIWALSDFREDNGATRIVPGSHKYESSPEYGRDYDAVTATMKAGSAVPQDVVFARPIKRHGEVAYPPAPC